MRSRRKVRRERDRKCVREVVERGYDMVIKSTNGCIRTT